MKYTLVIAALIGLITFEQVQQVRATQEIDTNNVENDFTLLELGEDSIKHNEQAE